MARTRPTITIDFEEYKELQEYKERFTKSVLGDYLAVIKVLSKHVDRSHYTLNAIKNALEEKGITFATIERASFDEPEVMIKRL